MLTSSEEQQDAIEALEAGAAGYITKTTRFDELLGAIREVHAGGRPIGEAVARRLAAVQQGGPLSPRELDVLELLRDGLSYQEIGRSLTIAERTARVFNTAVTKVRRCERSGPIRSARWRRNSVRCRRLMRAAIAAAVS